MTRMRAASSPCAPLPPIILLRETTTSKPRIESQGTRREAYTWSLFTRFSTFCTLRLPIKYSEFYSRWALVVGRQHFCNLCYREMSWRAVPRSWIHQVKLY